MSQAAASPRGGAGSLSARPGRRRRHHPATTEPLKYASWSPATTAATTGRTTARAGRPAPISAPASSVKVPPGSSTAGTATISMITAAHSTPTATAVGIEVSTDGSPAAASGAGITPAL